MADLTHSNDSHLPWVEAAEDKLFKYLLLALVAIFLLIGFVLNQMTLPPVQKKPLVDVAPRLAELILEKKKVKPPIKKKIVKQKPKKKIEKKPKPKSKEKKKSVAKPKNNTKQVKPSAKQVAQQSGLVALSDELADLRDSFDIDEIAVLPQVKAQKKVKQAVNTQKILTAKATQSSGGINTTAKRTISNTSLGQKNSAKVASNIQTKATIKQQVAAKKAPVALRARSSEEIERVFQKNKGALFNLYNRALRKDPSLQGKVVLELTIQPNGVVSQCRIVSSELGNKRLEKRIVSKVKKFKFENNKAPIIKVTYPIDFLPS